MLFAKREQIPMIADILQADPEENCLLFGSPTKLPKWWRMKA
jgi:hypothetical protein